MRDEAGYSEEPDRIPIVNHLPRGRKLVLGQRRVDCRICKLRNRPIQAPRSVCIEGDRIERAGPLL
jgi:hypothetical protein